MRAAMAANGAASRSGGGSRLSGGGSGGGSPSVQELRSFFSEGQPPPPPAFSRRVSQGNDACCFRQLPSSFPERRERGGAVLFSGGLERSWPSLSWRATESKWVG